MSSKTHLLDDLVNYIKRFLKWKKISIKINKNILFHRYYEKELFEKNKNAVSNFYLFFNILSKTVYVKNVRNPQTIYSILKEDYPMLNVTFINESQFNFKYQ